MNDGLDVFRAFVALEKSRRQQVVEQLRKEVQQTPVSEEVLSRLSQLNPDDFSEVMGSHPGLPTQRRIDSLWAGLENFRVSCRDLNERIRDFVTYRPQRRTRSMDIEREQIVASVRKEIFATSTAALALDAYGKQKRVRELVGNDQFESHRKQIFDEDQHLFVRELRNCLSHELFIPADWRITHRGDQEESAFEFRLANLLMSSKFTGAAYAYIQRVGGTVDVVTVFQDYAARVNRFYGWLHSEIESRLPVEVADYRRCVQSQRAQAFRTSYRLFLNIWIQRKIDPYEHLGDWLDEPELEEVTRLPTRSRVQVDRIIQFLDKYQACDDELRALVYRLFRAQS